MLRLAIFNLSCSSPRLQGSVLRTALGDTSSAQLERLLTTGNGSYYIVGSA